MKKKSVVINLICLVASTTILSVFFVKKGKHIKMNKKIRKMMCKSNLLNNCHENRVVSGDTIAQRAYELYKSGVRGSQMDHWLMAERELLSR